MPSAQCAPYSALSFTSTIDMEEETDKREGKGSHCCLGDGIRSFPCRTTDLASG